VLQFFGTLAASQKEKEQEEDLPDGRDEEGRPDAVLPRGLPRANKAALEEDDDEEEEDEEAGKVSAAGLAGFAGLAQAVYRVLRDPFVSSLTRDHK
jgi:hypothetical protein